MPKTNVLSALVHARSKQGKSTLASTAPLPLLVLDAEGSWKFIDEVGFKSGIPLRKRSWDPLAEEIPQYDGTWDALHVAVTSWDTIGHVYQHLTQAQHQIKSVVWDSITEVQRRCKRNLRGSEQMMQRDWGTLLDRMDDQIRSYRDLTLIQHNTIECVIFIAETKQVDGRWIPFMQGQIRDTLPYWVDICSFLYTEHTEDGNGQPTGKRKVLLVGESSQHETGERVAGRLPDLIADPNISAIMNAIYPTKENPRG